MYIPEAYRITETEHLYSFIERYDFATIVSQSVQGLVASHVPVLLQKQPGVLRAHFARANKHWQMFDRTAEALTIFHGPHAYVSPSWYVTSPAVPTWNYGAVHVYGRPRILKGMEDVKGLLSALTNKYEAHRKRPWQIEGAPAEFIEKLAAAIVAFEIPIERIEGKFKLGQNRSLDDRRGTVAGLQQENTQEARALADFMRLFGGVPSRLRR